MYSVFLTAKLQTGLKNVNHLTKSTVITSFPLKVFPIEHFIFSAFVNLQSSQGIYKEHQK
ncbi:hypothetical protein DXC76_06245 [Burkholderiales bacterium]|nr:hypothetical protein DXC76_06245 [Burkholderiales bacterium]HCO52132.1 hypothetical protein [Sutterellaceae bacterium]